MGAYDASACSAPTAFSPPPLRRDFFYFWAATTKIKSFILCFWEAKSPNQKFLLFLEGRKQKFLMFRRGQNLNFYKKNEANLHFFKKFRTEKFRFGDYILEFSPTGGLVASDHPKLQELSIPAYQLLGGNAKAPIKEM